ncbi:MAG TPA: heparinase II/III family protein [Candidatus Methylacidiphilales bacterium]
MTNLSDRTLALFPALALVGTFLVSGLGAWADEVVADPSGLPVPTQEQLDRIAGWLPQRPTGVGVPISDRAAWAEAAKQPVFQQQVKDAAQYLQEPIPDLSEELFNDILKTGLREPYEKPFRKRTTRLIAFTVAECIENQATYLPAIEAEIAAILAEKSWCAPAHMLGHPYGGFNGAIDLAAVVRAWDLATADYWLGDKLRPETRKAIREALQRRIFTNYEASVRSGKPAWGWMKGTNNWNMVCTSGVLGAALTSIDSPQERALFVQAALNSTVPYLSGLKDDGYCEEGIGYWTYGFGSYLCIAETLYQETQGQINLYEGQKIRNIALFLPHFQIIPGVFPAFGDAWARQSSMPPAIMQLINQRWGLGLSGGDFDPAKSDMFREHPLGDRLFGFGLFGFPLPKYGASLVAGAPAGEISGNAAEKDESKRFFFRDASTLICRSLQPDRPAFGLAIKGGTNGLPHGHNDNGSYVVAVGNVPLVLDPGMEKYSAKTFGPHRFESMMMNSYGHDVPYVGKTLQKEGVTALGKIVETRFTDVEDRLKMDLTTSYSVPGLVRLLRTYVFNRSIPSVEVIDEADFSAPTDYGTALVTLSSWQEKGPGSFLIYEKNSAVQATVTVEEGEGTIENKVEPITGFLLPPNFKPTRLGVNMSRPVTHLVLRTLIVPVPAPTPGPVQATN